MTITQRGTLSDGTHIQIEDWSMDYPGVYMESTTLAAYPVSRYSIPGSFAPKAGECFRAQFQFDTTEEALKTFCSLLDGKTHLVDHIERLSPRRYIPCLTGKTENTCMEVVDDD